MWFGLREHFDQDWGLVRVVVKCELDRINTSHLVLYVMFDVVTFQHR